VNSGATTEEGKGMTLHRLLEGKHNYILIFQHFPGLRLTCEFDQMAIKVDYRIKAPDPMTLQPLVKDYEPKFVQRFYNQNLSVTTTGTYIISLPKTILTDTARSIKRMESAEKGVILYVIPFLNAGAL